MDEKYQRIKVLGKGSFGKAYLVKNTEADELCVVKQMETSMMGKKEREEAVKEAMLLKRMDHKNIVRFQEVFMTRKGRLCIVMDYADGGDVHMEIKRREGELLPEITILEWFVQTCFALNHVHARKVLHRDLKTQNIFLMSTGQIKLGDFGIARVLDATKDYAKTMVGTPYYLSPEIIEDRPYNFKSDIWSLGVVLYEMTTLKHPFDADSLVTLASKILKDQYPPPDDMYSADLQSLIRSMLSKDAKVRPFVKELLFLPFLFGAMMGSNDRYALGMDLSEFVAQPPEPPPPPATAPAAAVPTASAEIAFPEAPPPGVADALGARNAAMLGTAPAAFGLNAAAVSRVTEESSTTAVDGGDDEDYDEDFEDYSEPEDGDEHPPSALQQSVANLKLGGGARSIDWTPAAGGSDASVPSSGIRGPSGGGAASDGLDSVPEDDSVGGTSGGSGKSIGAKADSLRKYLRSQVPETDFVQAYQLVRSSGEVGAEELQRRVAEIIGAEKAPELFTLFQLLCFLEDMSISVAPGQDAKNMTA